jgi:hypothetical protein
MPSGQNCCRFRTDRVWVATEKYTCSSSDAGAYDWQLTRSQIARSESKPNAMTLTYADSSVRIRLGLRRSLLAVEKNLLGRLGRRRFEGLHLNTGDFL